LQTPAGGAASGGAAEDGPAPDTTTGSTAAQAGESQAGESQASQAQASETSAGPAQASEAQAGSVPPGDAAGAAAGGAGAGGSRRTKVAWLAAAGVGVLVIAGVTIGTLSAASPAGHTANVSDRHSSGASAGTAAPLQVESVTQGGAVTRTDGASPVRVTLSAPLAANSPMPVLRPATPGTWTKAAR
jgi:hypothetical protein